MTTLVCGIDGCEHTTEVEHRGYMLMGLHRVRDHGLAKGTAPKPEKIDDGGRPLSGESGTGAPAPAPVVETPPKRRGWRERLRTRRDSKDTPAAAPSRERAPKRSFRGKRVPLDTDISDAWAFVGRRLEASPHYPTGRMMQYQAPGAGVILDKAVAGTFVDNAVLQPLARTRDRWEDAVYLLAGPLVTFGITRGYQELEVALRDNDAEAAARIKRRLEMQFEAFDWLIEAMLPRLAAGKKIAEEKKEKVRAVVVDAFPELAGTGISPAEALRNMIFAPPTFATGGTDEGTGQAAENGRGPHPVADREPAPGSA